MEEAAVLGSMSTSEIMAISNLLKEAAIALESGLDPAPFMRRLWGILSNAKSGGRLETPQQLYEIIDTSLNSEGIALHLSGASKPLKMAIEHGCKSSEMRDEDRLGLDLAI